MIVVVFVTLYVLLAFIGLAVLADTDIDDIEDDTHDGWMDKDNRPNMVRK